MIKHKIIVEEMGNGQTNLNTPGASEQLNKFTKIKEKYGVTFPAIQACRPKL